MVKMDASSDIKTTDNPVKNKIPCILLIYYNFEIIKKSIECLLKHKETLDLIIVENKSSFTDSAIKPFVIDLIKKQEANKYFLFDKNISNNALELVFDSREINTEGSNYIMLTDGDLTVESGDWLAEELFILEKNPDVFCCAISLDTSNLPLKTFPDAIHWIPPDIKIEDSYIEAFTGVHLLVFRTQEFKNFLQWRKENNVKFVDSVLHEYCYKVAHKKWAKTKKHLAKHLTWDIYNDLQHSYTKLKTSKTLEQIWNHNLYSPFEVYTKNSIQKYDIPKTYAELFGGEFVKRGQGIISRLIRKLRFYFRNCFGIKR